MESYEKASHPNSQCFCGSFLSWQHTHSPCLLTCDLVNTQKVSVDIFSIAFAEIIERLFFKSVLLFFLTYPQCKNICSNEEIEKQYIYVCVFICCMYSKINITVQSVRTLHFLLWGEKRIWIGRKGKMGFSPLPICLLILVQASNRSVCKYSWMGEESQRGKKRGGLYFLPENLFLAPSLPLSVVHASVD